ncbi:MAG: pseudouridine synthase [Candidatus Omnitrophica bacterium]|nr:pseudouridine synthase [Candidatus Omnitrophota bacterium]
MKLNLYIARCGYCSRRNAALLIKDGKVTVNGKPVLEPWFEVSDDDAVKACGKLLNAEKQVYILFNKPRGVTATCEDKFAEEKITDLIPKRFGRVYPVGRLDKNSRGLIILTNDGDLCHRFTHPKFEIEKEYIVTIEGDAEESIIKKLIRGVEDYGEILKVKSASISKRWPNKTQLTVIICEGKKRHLRRLFEALGYKVLDLLRIRIGRVNLADLKEGKLRLVDKKFIYSACS